VKLITLARETSHIPRNATAASVDELAAYMET
jgi:hypothetical protein